MLAPQDLPGVRLFLPEDAIHQTGAWWWRLCSRNHLPVKSEYKQTARQGHPEKATGDKRSAKTFSEPPREGKVRGWPLPPCPGSGPFFPGEDQRH